MTDAAACTKNPEILVYDLYIHIQELKFALEIGAIGGNVCSRKKLENFNVRKLLKSFLVENNFFHVQHQKEKRKVVLTTL